MALNLAMSVLVLWTMTIHWSMNSAGQLIPGFTLSVSPTSFFAQRTSLSDTVRTFEIPNAERIKRATQLGMVKIRLSNGSYLYRRVSASESISNSSSSSERNDPVKRIVRAYSNRRKGGKRGYSYRKRKKGYKYPSPQPPLSETLEDNSADYIFPPEPDPEGVQPEIGFELGTSSRPAPIADEYDIRDSIPGEPGKDYKVYEKIPKTNFTCEGRSPGFYADTQTGCQVFHRCSDDPWYTGQIRVVMDSFLCPNGSLFNQQIYTCDWWGNVNCQSAPDFYQLNEQIGLLEETQSGAIQYVKFSGTRVPPPPGYKQTAPKIIPKDERKPLPDKYRTKSRSKEDSLSRNDFVDDPDNLVKEFERSRNSFTSFRTENDRDKEPSSQNIDEVRRPPSSRRKSSSSRRRRPSRKRTKSTTTTTPASSEYDLESDEDEGSSEDYNEKEEGVEAREERVRGFIVNRKYEDSKDEDDGRPPLEALQPPRKSNSLDDPDGYESPDISDVATYIPPTTDYVSGTSPPTSTYLPPTTPSSGYGAPLYSGPNAPKVYGDPNSRPNNGRSYPGNQGSNQYLPPSTTGQNQNGNNFQTGASNNGYLPPATNNGYLPPNNNQNPQQTNLGTSGNPSQYLPPNSNQNSYPTSLNGNNGYTAQQNNGYLPPNQGQGFGSPTPSTNPSQQYLPVSVTHIQNSFQQRTNAVASGNNGYLSPQSTNNGYLPPQSTNNGYLPPNQGQINGNVGNPTVLPQNQSPLLSNQYGLPATGQNNYPTSINNFQPTGNNNGYLPPQNNGYLPPQQGQSTGRPQINPSNNQYLPPNGNQNGNSSPGGSSSNAYLPPSQNFGNSPANPTQLNTQYRPPSSTRNPSNNGYLPPQNGGNQPGGQNPNQISSQYLPTTQLSNSNAFSLGNGNNGYLPPSNNGQQFNQPQTASGYSQPNLPNNAYGVPGPINFPHTQAPTYQPRTGNFYSPSPNHYQGKPIQAGFNNGGYSAAVTQLPTVTTTEHWPAKFDYEAPTTPVNSLGYPGLSNSIATAAQGLNEYRTIPVQTPPPIDSYGAPSAVKFEMFQVPLVSSSHS